MLFVFQRRKRPPLGHALTLNFLAHALHQGNDISGRYPVADPYAAKP